MDEQYKAWVTELKERYRKSQIKAAVSVNRELLIFYWSLGRDIVKQKAGSKWGSGFIRQLSIDLQREMPDSKGFSRTNLLYMVNSYKMYPDTAIVPQLEGQTAPEPVPQPEGQDADIFAVPWGHHKLIIDRCRNDPDKALFYLRETLRCG